MSDYVREELALSLEEKALVKHLRHQPQQTSFSLKIRMVVFAPASIISFINNVFRDMLNKYLIVYIDDTLIYSETLEDHIQQGAKTPSDARGLREVPIVSTCHSQLKRLSRSLNNALLLLPSCTILIPIYLSLLRLMLPTSQRQGSPAKMFPCAFYSRKLNSAERNDVVRNRELLAMKAAFEEWASLAGGG
ncbi:Retrovirus-related Pol polyprotein from transposon 17.6 [Labeo rohita]|uniref:Retrovirus-related Pol polyprotein from transposon 17.6 n=1 Tax=Labeo rohita TaxID=84645 RepID=A0ABQ8LXF7_LABRO|nr:Retrovirus-related Pol polyprotein from transposon 17.6 [Labeo rohita]